MTEAIEQIQAAVTYTAGKSGVTALKQIKLPWCKA